MYVQIKNENDKMKNIIYLNNNVFLLNIVSYGL